MVYTESEREEKGEGKQNDDWHWKYLIVVTKMP